MIKVAFVVDAGWIGGINYYRNLLLAILKVPSRQIEPIILTGKKTNRAILADLPSVAIIQSSLLDRFSFGWIVNRAIGNNYLINILLVRNGVRVFSHTWHGGNNVIKTIGWIPDFQHTNMPYLFSKKELKSRNKQFMCVAKFCDRVILSSQDAYKDFVNFAPEYATKARVMRFVSVPSLNDVPTLDSLQKKYGFFKPYFYLPNQFWIHKNHKIIIEALAQLRSDYPDILVLSTGATTDYRHPNYFDELMALVRSAKITESFKILGVVPYSDVVSLMLNSTAIINPSLFEGWSTTVEEAKSLGVPLLLSDIPVHIEQAKDVAIYFSAYDAVDLAKKMIKIVNSTSVRKTDINKDKIAINCNRYIAFGITYQNIVMELVAEQAHKIS